MQKPKYSVVVPVYNTDATLAELVDRLGAVFGKTVKATFEVVFVNDGSPNTNTWPRLVQLAREHPPVRAINLSRNFGQGGALLCGLQHARGDWIITMDDDLQHYPEDIPQLVELDAHDVVIGRFENKKAGAFKKFASKVKSYLDVRLLGLPRGIVSTPFKLIKARVVKNMLTLRTPRPFMIAMLLLVTNDVVNVTVRHAPRLEGESGYSFRKALSLFSNMLFNNSTMFLRIMSIGGFWVATLSFLSGVFIAVRRLFDQTIYPGWASLIVVELFSTGVIVFCIGVLGEYVARLIAVSQHHPAFVVREEVGSDGSRGENR